MQNKKIVVLGSEVLPLGMKLAGVSESHTVKDKEDAERRMNAMLDRDDVGIIVISQGVAESITDRRTRYRIDNSLDPLVVSVADYNEKEGGEDTLRRLILRAVGVDILQDRTKS